VELKLGCCRLVTGAVVASGSASGSVQVGEGREIVRGPGSPHSKLLSENSVVLEISTIIVDKLRNNACS